MSYADEVKLIEDEANEAAGIVDALLQGAMTVTSKRLVDCPGRDRALARITEARWWVDVTAGFTAKRLIDDLGPPPDSATEQRETDPSLT